MRLPEAQRAALIASFDGIAETLRLNTLGGVLPDYLLEMYEETGRYYHNGKHLLHAMSELQAWPGPLDAHVGLALWFHDTIYDPARHDNEARCADLAAKFASTIGLSPESLLRVQRLILATDHRAPPAASDEALIMDIDLAILGQPQLVFDDYEYSIRLEYAHVLDADFKLGRAKILRQFLARPTIYYTPHFQTRYEAQARGNMERSLAKLR